nr:hypothetical protein [Tanacetum cinerariifolium]
GVCRDARFPGCARQVAVLGVRRPALFPDGFPGSRRPVRPRRAPVHRAAGAAPAAVYPPAGRGGAGGNRPHPCRHLAGAAPAGAGG